MLPAARRLTASRDFAATTRRGRRTSTSLLVLHVLRSPAAGEPLSLASDAVVPVVPAGRVGFVVSRAVGNAVTRNRVERRLRHAVRDHLDLVPDGSTVVVRATPAAARAGFGALEHDLVSALRRTATPTDRHAGATA